MKPNDFFIIRPRFCVAVCVALLLLPLKFVLSWLCAVVFHEMGHTISLNILRIPIRSIIIDLHGASIETRAMTTKERFISIISGPLAGLSTVFLSRWIPYIAIFALVQNVYNLIPLRGHDGWQLLECILSFKCTRRNSTAILYAGEVFSLLVISGFCIYAMCNLGIGLSALIFGGCLWIRYFNAKTPCKDTQQIVQ